MKYYAKKILYFLRQQNILRALKSFLEQPPEQQSALAGEKTTLGPSPKKPWRLKTHGESAILFQVALLESIFRGPIGINSPGSIFETATVYKFLQVPSW